MSKLTRNFYHSNQPSLLVKELAARFSIQPVCENIFVEAFTHSSFANEHQMPSNERLEFLGDSVLALIVSEFLYEHFPDKPEGTLAKYKAIIVSSIYWEQFAKQLSLNELILLGEGELKSQGNQKRNVLADLFEAFIGAFYLNFGLKQTVLLVLPLVEKILPEIIAQTNLIDAKSHLQELTQAKGLIPVYRLIAEEGPPHAKIFKVDVTLNQKVIGTGMGQSLKEAQRQAAIIGIANLTSNDNFY